MEINDKLQFNIVTMFKDGTTDEERLKYPSTISLGVNMGYFDSLGQDSAGELHRHNLKSINAAGFRNVNVLLDDMTAKEKDEGGLIPVVDGVESAGALRVSMAPVNPAIRIRPILEYLKKNSRFVKSVTLTCNDGGMFDGSFTFGDMSPFYNSATREQAIDKGVNQFAQDKVIMDYALGTFDFNEFRIFIINGIPCDITGGGMTKLNVVVEFYSQKEDAYKRAELAGLAS